ncbi:TonB-dependent receptor [Rhodoplanes sp. TEM]|uniref:TonB-dependent receptor n=1 Tax=Rhodoplanes tepidamans TaxID=200616 RepID=A0ABT5J5X0_RHOTP|nr:MULTISPECIES: TonB-dependent receptor [Rhodoplanes]MDC7784699.1 TonB-dependent receptor [Rhodoplanes tepidamans]MDC7982166.1 TonB-dependent receptor [Rhodoplanes sp. TEM]MDQ0356170.1 iron complex outermembrane receptor protein [Rhodoplanes tepidamans]
MRHHSASLSRAVLLSTVAALLPCVAVAQTADPLPAAPVSGAASASEPVLLETVVVTVPRRSPAPARSGSGRGSSAGAPATAVAPGPATAEGPVQVNPPPFAVQARRALRRPGAESVVSVTQQDPGTRSNLRQVLDEVPGVLIGQRGGENSQGSISIRGSDTSQAGPRGGRGVRAFADGVPLGRLVTGVTLPLLDLKATDYIEVYRGASSLRYGALATGGAINLVSKTGRTAPGATISTAVGSNNFRESQIELGGFKDKYDWYFQVNDHFDSGYELHSRNYAPRFSGNFGWQPTEAIENRTYVAVGKNLQELPTAVPLSQLSLYRQSGFDPSKTSFPYDLRANYEYQRVVNKTVIRSDTTSVEIAPYFLRSAFDHLPSTAAGIQDVTWTDYGVSLRVENRNELIGRPTELVFGYRPTYEDASYKTYQWAKGSSGSTKASLVYDDAFHAWFHEGYGEAAVEVMPRVKLFTGAQAFWTDRNYHDSYSGPKIASGTEASPALGIGVGPGSSNGLRNYEREFSAFNPKFGVNWEYVPEHFVYANYARSTEVPNAGDISSLLTLQQTVNGMRPGTLNMIDDLAMQRAWTIELGVRGGWDRFRYDVAVYDMRLNDEILSACALNFIPLASFTPAQRAQLRGQFACSNANSLVAFNVDKTRRTGIEAGFKTRPIVDVLASQDHVYLDMVYTYIDSRFVDDPTFGDAQLPLTPRHQAYAELGYRHPAGFFVAGNIRFVGERWTTFDNSGGDAFVVPASTLYGARIGWKAPDRSWTLWAEGRNLTDEAYVSDFAPLLRSADAPTTPGGTPFVYAGAGRAFYVGFSKTFN